MWTPCINVYKAIGPNGIFPKILYEAAAELTELLTIIFNKSLEAGDIPTDWKSAVVTAIHKKRRQKRTKQLQTNFPDLSCCQNNGEYY